MPTPAKPAKILEMEKRSHRTKKEIAQRKNAEAALLTGVVLKEKREVKNNQIAHKEFQRLRKLLKSIDKDDDLYGETINRYCMLIAECEEFQQKREKIYEQLCDFQERMHHPIIHLPVHFAIPAQGAFDGIQIQHHFTRLHLSVNPCRLSASRRSGNNQILSCIRPVLAMQRCIHTVHILYCVGVWCVNLPCFRVIEHLVQTKCNPVKAHWLHILFFQSVQAKQKPPRNAHLQTISAGLFPKNVR